MVGTFVSTIILSLLTDNWACVIFASYCKRYLSLRGKAGNCKQTIKLFGKPLHFKMKVV